MQLGSLAQALNASGRALIKHSALSLLALCLLVLLFLQSLSAFAPSNRWLYDHALHAAYQWRWAEQAAQAGVYRQSPVLVAIDEASLHTLGRWPWPRQVHAQLLDRLQQTPKPARVIAWDVVFAEPQALSLKPDEQTAHIDGDGLFADAIARSSVPVLLAAQIEQEAFVTRLVVPQKPLSHTPARMAHVHIDADADGAVRRFWPVDSRIRGHELTYLGVALLSPLNAPAINASEPAALVPTASLTPPTVDISQGLYPMPRDWVRRVSYQDVLSGTADPRWWADVPVLIAATAKGLGDQYVAALYEPSGVVAGAELVLGAMHTTQLLRAGLPPLVVAPWYWQWLGWVLTLAMVLYGLRRSQHWRTQLAVLAGVLLMLGAVGLTALALGGVWLNLSQMFFAAVLAWMLWMSYTVQRFVAHVQGRLQQLNRAPASLPALDQATRLQAPLNAEQTVPVLHKQGVGNAFSALSTDLIDTQLSVVELLEQQQQADFVRLNHVLNLLPDAAFVLQRHASTAVWTVQLHNLAAQQLCTRLPALQAAMTIESGSLAVFLSQLFIDFLPDLTAQQWAVLQSQNGWASQSLAHQQAFNWQDLQHHHADAAFAQGVEASTQQGERFLIKLALMSALPDPAGLAASAGLNNSDSMIVSVVDLSVGRALAQSRERTLHFLSHDLRAPQASIVALLDLEKPSHPELAAVFSKIEFHAQRTLHLAEGFVQWSQASHRPAYHFAEYDLNELMVEALDEQWASAKRKGVFLNGDAPDQALWVLVDRNLLWRALVNLISNALNACQPGQEVRLSTWQNGNFAAIAVQDNGPGIPSAAQAQLFEPFVQGGGLKRTGAGLGLAFVKTVTEQHQGNLLVHSPVFDGSPDRLQAHGTRFELWLPLCENAPEDELDSTLS